MMKISKLSRLSTGFIVWRIILDRFPQAGAQDDIPEIVYNDGGFHVYKAADQGPTYIDVSNSTSLDIASFTILDAPECCSEDVVDEDSIRPTIRVMDEGSFLNFDGEMTFAFGSNHSVYGGTAMQISGGASAYLGVGALQGGDVPLETNDEDFPDGGNALAVQGVNSMATINGTTLIGGEGYYPGHSLYVRHNANVTILAGDIQDTIYIDTGGKVYVKGGNFRRRIVVVGSESRIQFLGCFRSIFNGLREEVIGTFEGSETTVRIEVYPTQNAILDLVEVGECELPPQSGSPTPNPGTRPISSSSTTPPTPEPTMMPVTNSGIEVLGKVLCRRCALLASLIFHELLFSYF
mmetsp:Transcript_31558/g.67559  ORF Transcript_31558/g.67559 Transcript_31558/m.67559 type:complete len:350 (-) Transcript_31558:236-1285(-)